MNSVLRLERSELASPSGASIVHSAVGGGARLTLGIDNFSHILSAYGADAAKAVAATVDIVLDQLRTGGCMASSDHAGHVSVAFGQRSLAEAAGIVEVVVAQLSAHPVRLGDHHFHLALACPAVGAAMAGDRRPAPACDPADPCSAWAATYRRDMAIASEVMVALREGRLLLTWQPVVAAESARRLLYHEGLARIIGTDGREISPALFVPALERVGLVRAFDRWLVALALDELESCPHATLAVNISGKSACIDGWWGSLFARLRDPDIARRLIVEITETAPLCAEAPAFAAALRRLGCRIALDDFGMGHASVRCGLSLAPDIIKIDAFFLRNAALSRQGAAMLEHLIGIAGSVAPVVVIEGVETVEQRDQAARLQARLAPRSGGCWQQGYLHGRPSFWRSWRHAVEPEDYITVPIEAIEPAGSGEFRPWFPARHASAAQ